MAASMKNLRSCIRHFRLLNSFVHQVRGYKRHTYGMLQELYKRRNKLGPDRERHPSEFGAWNYDLEISVYSKKFGVEIDRKLLKEAFIQRSYVEAQEMHGKPFGIEFIKDAEENMITNEHLAERGYNVCKQYIDAFLRNSFPRLFEDFIQQISSNILSADNLYLIAQNLGMREIIKSGVYPPEADDYPRTLLAVVGAIRESYETSKEADEYVKDFILSSLLDKNINDFYEVKNPMGLLMKILEKESRPLPESRMLFKSGTGTLMASYHVGIYSDQQLLGRSCGETPYIAEEMAARNALEKWMGTEYGPFSLQINKNNQILDFKRVNQQLPSSQVSHVEQETISSSSY